MENRSGNVFDDDTKDIFAATFSLPPSDLIAMSTSLFRGWRARKFVAATHPLSPFSSFSKM
jgi:hypothetical protein